MKNLAYVNETIDDYNAIIVKINKFKLEYQLATGKTLKKMGALKGQEIQQRLQQLNLMKM